jgi:predicted RNase H-like HicB family nuclease
MPVWRYNRGMNNYTPRPHPEGKYLWYVTLPDGRYCAVQADTRSEARAKAKVALGIAARRPLPSGARVQRLHPITQAPAESGPPAA